MIRMLMMVLDRRKQTCETTRQLILTGVQGRRSQGFQSNTMKIRILSEFDSSLSFELSVPSATGYYEVCLAVVEESTTYYLHQHLCIEVSPRTVPSPPSLSSSLSSPSSSTTTLSTNLTVVPDIKSVAVGWQLAEGNHPVVRQISVRR